MDRDISARSGQTAGRVWLIAQHGVDVSARRLCVDRAARLPNLDISARSARQHVRGCAVDCDRTAGSVRRHLSLDVADANVSAGSSHFGDALPAFDVHAAAGCVTPHRAIDSAKAQRSARGLATDRAFQVRYRNAARSGREIDVKLARYRDSIVVTLETLGIFEALAVLAKPLPSANLGSRSPAVSKKRANPDAIGAFLNLEFQVLENALR